MLRRAGVAVVALLAVGLLAVLLQPGAYRVERSATVAAPPERVASLVRDFRQWDGWSPWAKLDPQMQVTYGGAAEGAGATYSWKGNDEVGEGRMTMLESDAQHVAIDLEFLKPFPSRSRNEFRFTPEGAGTKVDWIMTGELDFLGKAFGLVMGGMDRAIGKDFEKGLAQLKALAEK